VKENNPALGIDCMLKGTSGMYEFTVTHYTAPYFTSFQKMGNPIISNSVGLVLCRWTGYLGRSKKNMCWLFHGPPGHYPRQIDNKLRELLEYQRKREFNKITQCILQ
jgi:hypothetical protein